VICDYKLPDTNALDLLPHLRAINPSVAAIQAGADHFLTKPIELLTTLARPAGGGANVAIPGSDEQLDCLSHAGRR